MKKSNFLILSLIVILGIAAWVFIPTKGKRKDVSLDETIIVKRADMIIGVDSSGTINAKKNHKLSIQARVNAKVTWLIDENTLVKKDDVLIKFDDEELINKVEDLQLKYENGLKELEIAKEELTILYSSNEASLRQARDQLVTSEETLLKYKQLEGPRSKDNQALKVETARKDFETAKNSYNEGIGKASMQVFNSKAEEDNSKKETEKLLSSMKQKESSYTNSLLDHKIFKRYTYRNKIESLDNSVKQAELTLKSKKVQAESKVMQKKSSLIRLQNNSKRTLDQLETQKKYLKLMFIKSPVSGVVIYGDPTQRWSNLDLKIGHEAYYRQTLMTIPDLSSMLVKFSLPEAYRSKVQVGNEVIVSPDSLPGVKLQGLISVIDPLPISLLRWDQNSPKIYKAVIELATQDKRLVSGMSAKIEVITQVLKNVIAIPIESIFEEKDQFFVYYKQGEEIIKRNVSIGASDESSVNIISGLDEGDEIFLYNPYTTGE
ncbi:MAG: efflux RND transporter periplasmic adaptor subunit [Lentisphaeria bacterium]|nr:efflux RND transporter periplasmic adaptor subunit [Lentisphaeria bacterium]